MMTKKEILKTLSWAIFIALSIHIVNILWIQKPERSFFFSQKKLPAFNLLSHDGKTAFSNEDLQDGIHVLNFFASWCMPCKTEHKYLFSLKKEGVFLHGVYTMDKSENIDAYLTENGNPYDTLSQDNRQLSMELGLMGIPATYIIDGKTKDILYYIHGPILESYLKKEILPLIEEQLKIRK